MAFGVWQLGTIGGCIGPGGHVASSTRLASLLIGLFIVWKY